MNARIKKVFLRIKLLSCLILHRPQVFRAGKSKKAVILFSNAEIKRPLLLLLYYLSYSGFVVVLKTAFRDYLRTGEYLLKAFSYPGFRVSVIPCRIGRADILFTNKEADTLSVPKKVVINFDVFTKINREHKLFYPIMFHPNFLHDGTFRKIEQLCCNQDRRIKIFFAGNIDRNTYDKERTRYLFSVETRYQIIEFIRSYFLNTALVEPASLRELKSGMEKGIFRNKIVICDSNLFEIPHDDWFDILSFCEYFLSPPGVLQPFCHNTVEAMAVGAIPILQYPEVYEQALEDMKNCIHFKNIEDLAERIGQILDGFYDSAMYAMRNSAKAYYDRNFSPESFKEKIDSFLASDENETELFLCQNALSVSLFEQYRERIIDR